MPYVVINQATSFDPTKFGFDPLCAVTVVCNGRMFHAFWGDTNPYNQIGEAAYSLGEACFGDSINGNNASPDGVFYMAWSGPDAVTTSSKYSDLTTLGQDLLLANGFYDQSSTTTD